MPWLNEFSDWLAHRIGADPDTLWRFVSTVLIVFCFSLARRLVVRALARTVSDPAVRYGANKVFTYAIGLVALIAIARVWFQGVGGVVTYLGLVSAGLAVALQEPIANLFGFGFILWRRPFEVGDRIEIGAHAGDVVDVRLFQFTLLEVGNWVKADQSTGRVIHIPNGWVFRHATANFNKGIDHIWNELAVTVTFESDWRLAKQLLTQVLSDSSQVAEETVKARVDAAANRYFIRYMNLTPIVWTSLSDDGVVLTLRYLCDPRRRRSSASDLWERILDQFAQHKSIDFAYRTHRQFLNPSEGKEDLGGKRRLAERTSAVRFDEPAKTKQETTIDTTDPRR
ncbi:MAG TPA: mechanosensitive ion channel domain-containing protein [Polyangiaceae bacterium]|nr:mechanosensitive ion channel domain-containing protein [Polyangiaceae bacterium]